MECVLNSFCTLFQLKEYIDDTEDFINIQLVHSFILLDLFSGLLPKSQFRSLNLKTLVGQCAEPANPVRAASNDRNICGGHLWSGGGCLWHELPDIIV